MISTFHISWPCRYTYIEQVKTLMICTCRVSSHAGTAVYGRLTDYPLVRVAYHRMQVHQQIHALLRRLAYYQQTKNHPWVWKHNYTLICAWRMRGGGQFPVFSLQPQLSSSFELYCWQSFCVPVSVFSAWNEARPLGCMMWDTECFCSWLYVCVCVCMCVWRCMHTVSLENQ